VTLSTTGKGPPVNNSPRTAIAAVPIEAQKVIVAELVVVTVTAAMPGIEVERRAGAM